MLCSNTLHVKECDLINQWACSYMLLSFLRDIKFIAHVRTSSNLTCIHVISGHRLKTLSYTNVISGHRLKTLSYTTVISGHRFNTLSYINVISGHRLKTLSYTNVISGHRFNMLSYTNVISDDRLNTLSYKNVIYFKQYCSIVDIPYLWVMLSMCKTKETNINVLM